MVFCLLNINFQYALTLIPDSQDHVYNINCNSVTNTILNASNSALKQQFTSSANQGASSSYTTGSQEDCVQLGQLVNSRIVEDCKYKETFQDAICQAEVEMSKLIQLVTRFTCGLRLFHKYSNSLVATTIILHINSNLL